ncbi:MAG: ABC transporter ATP-binding protein [Saprospiraceae bacterium]|nr:ABC transporter ATP-binding protein [Saprospiraceae bacterium]
MEHLASLNKYFWKYKGYLLAGIAFVTISNYFRILQPQMLRRALDLVVDNIGLYRLTNGFDAQTNLYGILGKSLLFFGAMVLILALLMGIFMYFMRQTIIVMSRLIEYDMRKSIYDHYQALNLAFYKRNSTGDLMSRVTEDVNKVRNYLGPTILYGVNLVTLFALTIYSMVSVSPTLTFYSLIPLPFLVGGIYYVSIQISRRSEKIQQQLAALNSSAQEAYSGIRVVKSYVREEPIVSHFATQSEVYKSKALNLARIDNAFFPVMLLCIGASTIITVYVGGLQVVAGNITPGNIAEFVIYVGMLTWPVTSIGWIASLTQQAAASQKRINEFLHTVPEIAHTTTKNGSVQTIQGNIEFKNVSFTYPDTGILALKNVNFKLKKGDKLAIIGKTGSGKSTIADLLVRLYDVTEGVILIDGKDIRDMPLDTLRQQMGYVPQDVFLFSDTVAGNIAFGKKGVAERSEVEQFARHAAVYDDIMGLTEGFDTMVGERGVTLSGGQKQRISIARALIKQPNIVLLDDCLSAVDTTTEQTILGYLNEALAEKTSIIITHRIHGLLQFDKIIVLDNGAIVEEGTHDFLMLNGGYYAEIFEQQRMQEEVH